MSAHRMWRWPGWVLLASCASLLGCGPATPSRRQAKSTTNQTFVVRGVVQEIKAKGLTARIKHDAIPNYMPAMTMDFDVRDAKELKGINAGDVVSFRLVVTDDEGWIEQVRRVSTAPGEMPTRENAAAVRTLDPLQPGEVFPDYHFTNELGRAVSLRDFRGKALAVTFIFTRCPFPEFCPKLSKGFAAAYQKLKSERDAPPNWKLLSISFDPEFDTPAVLKSYAQRYSYDSAQWSFLTGSFEEIGGLAAQAGLRFGKEGDSISHNVRTIVIDAQGRLRRVFSDTKWTADDLATELIAAAGTQ